MTVTNQDGGGVRRYLVEAVMNVAWFAITVAGLAVVHFLWPHQSWSWGLLLGAAVGGSAVMVLAQFVVWRYGGWR